MLVRLTARASLAATALTVPLLVAPVTLAFADGAGAPTARPSVAPTGELLVRYQSGTSDATQRSVERAAGVARLRAIPQLGVALVRPSVRSDVATSRLRATGRVAYVEPNGVLTSDAVTPNDPSWPQQWGLAKVGAPTAWGTTTGRSDVTIAVLDTGVDSSAADLAGVVQGPDFVNNDAVPADDHGHGTRALSIAGARGDNASAIAGACFTCRVVAVKVSGADGTATWAAVAQGLTWAADNGARIVSISISGNAGSQTLRDAIRYAQRKALVVASAGNIGDTAVRYPASYPDVLSVAGSDNTDARYGWSTHGSWVDVAAPGCNPAVDRNGTVMSFCGTSSATPLVAGIAGLLLSAKPTLRSSEVSAALTTTAVEVSYVASGRVDAAAAMARVTGIAITSPTTSPTSSPSPTTTTSTKGGGKPASTDVSPTPTATSTATSPKSRR